MRRHKIVVFSLFGFIMVTVIALLIIGNKPFKALKASDIADAKGQIFPPGTIITISEREEIVYQLNLDFDETRYETEDVKKFQDIKDIIFSSTYEEVENPEFEGGYIFEITTDKETYDLVISGNMVTINEQTYRISNKTLAKQLIEIIGLREERTYSETS